MKAVQQIEAAIRDISSGEHFCTRKCNRVTRWTTTRAVRHGVRVQKCEGCGSRFPCANDSCSHEDCARARAHAKETVRP